MQTFRLVAVMLLPLAAITMAQTAPEPKSPSQSEAAQRGKSQFAKTCSFCHGPDAAGGAEGPNLLLSGVVRHDKNGDLISVVIHEGRPSKGMPPIALTADQTADLVAFLHARVTESDRRSAGKPSQAYSLKTLLTGNAHAGKVYFEAHCTTCHSAGGDLKNVASKYSPIDLQARFLYPPDVPQTATVTDDSGRSITGRVVAIDSFNLSLLDSKGWYHSWPREDIRFEIPDLLAGHRQLLAQYSEQDVHNLFAYLETLK